MAIHTTGKEVLGTSPGRLASQIPASRTDTFLFAFPPRLWHFGLAAPEISHQLNGLIPNQGPFPAGEGGFNTPTAFQAGGGCTPWAGPGPTVPGTRSFRPVLGHEWTQHLERPR